MTIINTMVHRQVYMENNIRGEGSRVKRFQNYVESFFVKLGKREGGVPNIF